MCLSCVHPPSTHTLESHVRVCSVYILLHALESHDPVKPGTWNMEQRNNYCTCAVGSEDSTKLTWSLLFRSASPVTRPGADPGIFSGGGGSRVKTLKRRHINWEICIRNTQKFLQKEGVRTPWTLPLDQPLQTINVYGMLSIELGHHLLVPLPGQRTGDSVLLDNQAQLFHAF